MHLSPTVCNLHRYSFVKSYILLRDLFKYSADTHHIVTPAIVLAIDNLFLSPPCTFQISSLPIFIYPALTNCRLHRANPTHQSPRLAPLSRNIHRHRLLVLVLDRALLFAERILPISYLHAAQHPAAHRAIRGQWCLYVGGWRWFAASLPCLEWG